MFYIFKFYFKNKKFYILLIWLLHDSIKKKKKNHQFRIIFNVKQLRDFFVLTVVIGM